MKCNQCGTENLEDSKFCKECGLRLVQDEAATEAKPKGQLAMQEIDSEERAEEVKALLHSAIGLLDSDEYESAINDATRAVELDPDNVLAHRLLVTLLEHTGDYEGAYEHQSRVVELDPTARSEQESLARLQRLRRSAWTQGIEKASSNILRDRMPQIVFAGAVGLSILVLGIIFLKPKPPVRPIVPAASQSTAAGSDAKRYGTDGALSSMANRQPTSQPGIVYQSPTPTRSRPMNPPALEDIQAQERAKQEAQKGNPPTVAPAPVVNPPSPKPVDAEPKPEPPAKPEKNPPPVPPILSGNDGTGGTLITNRPGVQPPPPPQPPKPVPAKSPYESFREGNYSEAIKGFQAQLRDASVDQAGKLHKWLAFSYRNLGQNDQARTEFKRAVQAYQAQINAGIKVHEAQDEINTCNRALEAL